MKTLARWLFKLLWRVEVRGLEHYTKVDQSQTPMLIVANHQSLLDGPLIDLFVPGRTTFMIHTDHTGGWKRWLLKLADFIVVDMQSPLAAKHMIEALRAGKQGMIFPEGRISTTGGLMKVYEGTGLVADKAGAMILPVQIENAHLSRFSYLDGRVRWTPRRWFPKITLTILPPQSLNIPAELKGHARHAQLKSAIYLLMRDSQFYARYQPKNLTQALLDAKQQFGYQACSIADAQGNQLGLKKLVLAARVLGLKLDQSLPNQTYVGVMLPNVAGMVAVFFALQAYGRVPALLNFTAGEAALRSACETAQLKTILTSRKFIELAGLERVAQKLAEQVELVYLEDLREQIDLSLKLKALSRSVKALPGRVVDPQKPAVVLFTSGSEGTPKAVLLSHANIVANIEQVSAMFSLLPGDPVFNALPTFHSFGLTAGLLWPLLKGARVELHPSPLHYSIIPERIYQTNARLFFATDSFYRGYAKKADPYDFYSIDALVAGAEKLKPETRQLYSDKFHKPIFEGYGVTETAPVLAVNIPQMCQHGTVGQLVAGMEYRLEPVAGLVEGGQLWVKGPNVMLGYFKTANPGVLVPIEDGWYDTGDIVTINAQGFITIQGRAKRFAKIAGEMVSLSAIEAAVARVCHQGQAVAVRLPDELKGERIVLVTDDTHLNKQQVSQAIRLAGLSELAVPKTILFVEQIPLLGTGKVNYPAVDQLASS
ncbi:AMP-binding protein [Thiomicrospira sp. R3]|uniref:AMP-binding protein n=1 Tax=Thiomicrospira sp. R3 TaxID=3035472 RepID=UPI00259B5FF4|nr:AMP-binding protein [Thiomicrospira sp. R3]WFE69596.1 AMP-binding protein [Thiomicrospira sp. R3]